MNHSIQRRFAGLALFCALLFAPTDAAASGLVQVTLSGNLDMDGGMRVEFAVEAAGSKANFHGHLALDTQPADLAALFERRLKKAGIEVIMGADKGPRGPFTFFIEDCESILLRAGGGFDVRVTAVEEAPIALRLLPPRTMRETARGDLRVFVATESVADKREGIVELRLDLPETRPSATWVAEHLSSAASVHSLKSRRPSPDAWSSSGTTKGAVAVGMSVQLYSSADWAIEMRLAPRVGKR